MGLEQHTVQPPIPFRPRELTDEVEQAWRAEAQEGDQFLLVIRDKGLDEVYPVFYRSEEAKEQAKARLRSYLEVVKEIRLIGEEEEG